MGLRNPFRFAVNRKNGDVYVGDYSPDAGAANPLRGPAGHGRWMLIKRAGELRLAVLRHADDAVHRLRLRHQDLGRGVQLQRADERLAVQHGPEAAAGVTQPDVWYSLRRVAAVPGAGPGGHAGRHRADGRPGL